MRSETATTTTTTPTNLTEITKAEEKSLNNIHYIIKTNTVLRG
jgi:hypothetical protein